MAKKWTWISREKIFAAFDDNITIRNITVLIKSPERRSHPDFHSNVQEVPNQENDRRNGSTMMLSANKRFLIEGSPAF